VWVAAPVAADWTDRCEVAVSGPTMLEGETEAACRAAGGRHERGVVGLGEVDEARVVAEVGRQQFGVPIEAEALDHEAVEVARQEVGQEEGAELTRR